MPKRKTKAPKEESGFATVCQEIQVLDEDIARGGRTFSCNPVIWAFKRMNPDIPIHTLGIDLAYVNGREYLATLESADTLAAYLFGGHPLRAYTHVLEEQEPAAFAARIRHRAKQASEKAAAIRVISEKD